MRSIFNQHKFELRIDTAFSEVIRSCQKVKRKGQSSSWIHPEMIKAYERMYSHGYAHSVEAWEDNKLVGGLYGIALGKMFFGESMFTTVANASKFALISLCQKLEEDGFTIIDCQQETSHLIHMGASIMTAKVFWEQLKINVFCDHAWK